MLILGLPLLYPNLPLFLQSENLDSPLCGLPSLVAAGPVAISRPSVTPPKERKPRAGLGDDVLHEGSRPLGFSISIFSASVNGVLIAQSTRLAASSLPSSRSIRAYASACATPTGPAARIMNRT